MGEVIAMNVGRKTVKLVTVVTGEPTFHKHKCKGCKKNIEAPIYIKTLKRDNKYYHLSCYYEKLNHQIGLAEEELIGWNKTKRELEKKYMGEIRKETGLQK